MTINGWVPIGYSLPDGTVVGRALHEGADWQIFSIKTGGRALIAQTNLAERWLSSDLLAHGQLKEFHFGKNSYSTITCSADQILCPVTDGISPNSKTEAMSFAITLKATREIDSESALQDAIFVEKYSRLLPTYTISLRTEDDVVLGYWLTGGAPISAKSFRRLGQTLSWLSRPNLKHVVEAAGFAVLELTQPNESQNERPAQTEEKSQRLPRTNEEKSTQPKIFELAGRPALADFFNEHIIDIIINEERYRALGIGFPSAIVLHGPPGCGKTYAVDRLVDFLGWPSYQIDASSVASPYIHETSKKVADVFEKAIQNSPSVLVLDEMEAFLADRELGSGHHRVEEVAEFLRRIPEATSKKVLIVAMTNRIEMIDPAILRRGRFDHVVNVDFASEVEILNLLEHLFKSLPMHPEVDPIPLAKSLSGRPLSDVSYVVREGARLAARAGKSFLDQDCLCTALESAPARAREGGASRKIGFI